MKIDRAKVKERMNEVRAFLVREKLLQSGGTISGEWLKFLTARYNLTEKNIRAAIALEAASQGIMVEVKRSLNREEDDLQQRCIEWFDRTHANKELLHHSPNEGERKVYAGARNKAMGTRAGRPDLEYNIARGGYHGLFIELKTASGRLSQEQRANFAALQKQGYRCEIVRTEECFKKLITEYENS